MVWLVKHLAGAWSTFTFFFILISAVEAQQLSDTGQDKCYAYNHPVYDGVEVTCHGHPWGGQDADYNTAPWPSYQDNGDGTVTDLNSRLTWQQHDDGVTRAWQPACDYCESLELAGYDDWRLASRRELVSLLHFGTWDPAVDTEYFPSCRSAAYWTSTTCNSTEDNVDSNDAYLISFEHGGGTGVIHSYGGKNGQRYARCVRGNSIAPGNYADNGDGTVTDNTTGLMWQQDVDPTLDSWDPDIEYCGKLSLAGYYDWRLPNILELESLVDYSPGMPILNPVFGDRLTEYTSSTSMAYFPHDVWVINFGYGSLHHRQKQNLRLVRCVRLAPPGEYWQHQKSNTGSSLVSVHFIDKQNGWSIGGSTIVKTENGGRTWEVLPTDFIWPLGSVYFVDKNNGWVTENALTIGGKGRIYHTQDGGATWSEQSTGTTGYFSNVFFVNRNIGWVIGGNTILKTTNGGQDWSPQSSDSTDSLMFVFFLDQNTGWIVGGNGLILYTNNSGIDWNPQISGTSNALNCIRFSSATTGWAVGYNGTILHTSDDGSNWTEQVSGTDARLSSLSILNEDTVWVVGRMWDNFWRTENKGITWEKTYSGTPTSLSSIYFINSKTGWAVGDDGTILSTDGNSINTTPWIPLLLFED